MAIGTRAFTCVAAILPLFAAACGTGDHGRPPTLENHPLAAPQATQYTFPSRWAGDYSFQWSTADGIELNTPAATVVRAFAESKRLAMSVGARLAYPGYADAVADVDWLRVPAGGAYPPGADEGNWSLRWSGTFRARIIDLRPDADGYRTVYCLDANDVADSADGGATYRWRRPGDRREQPRGRPVWLAFEPETPMLPPHSTEIATAATGPDRAPHYNVFDGWHITDVWGPSPRVAEESYMVDECADWTRASPRRNPIDIDSAERTAIAAPPPEPEPPIPGWPAET
ncbi:hypothetical protein [Nocardia gamkensis]|uniref:hypothetical protein n=1 Tax=Nocardia gamkensis TaxID=352869 RepID=UPI0037C64081